MKERARYYQCNLPSCAGPLKDARCMKYPASTPNPTPTPRSMPSKRTTLNYPFNFAPTANADGHDIVIPLIPPDEDSKMSDPRPNLQTKHRPSSDGRNPTRIHKHARCDVDAPLTQRNLTGTKAQCCSRSTDFRGPTGPS